MGIPADLHMPQLFLTALIDLVLLLAYAIKTHSWSARQ